MADRTRSRGLVVAVATVMVLAACGQATTSGSDDVAPDVAAGDATPVPSAAEPGPGVPDIPVTDFDGGTVVLTDYAGTPLVVNFWASWCPPCIAEMPDLEAVSDLAEGQVTFVGVNTQDTPERADDLVVETGVTYDLVADPEGALARAFGVIGMPSTFYVGADGTIVDRHTGLLTRDALVADLAEHLDVDVVEEAGAAG